ncbi:MAG: magnesium transporter, partial [bacterium]|nr:magnesium transporter [bacterium]
RHLLGVVSYARLFSSPPEKTIREIMDSDMVSVPEDCDQEEVARVFQRHKYLAIPVVDYENRMKGIVTMDDIMDVLRQENTEDIQKIGGVETLETSYMRTGFLQMIRKRAGWLTILFLGEMMTATAMVYFQNEIAQAVVLALFIPLIISSGGNAGSQASTLVIRAMALGEVRLRDWWRVFFREAGSGLTLGMILGGIALLRVLFWPTSALIYGEHFVMIAWTVSFSLVGVVLWGTVVGASLPFVLRRLGFDPATASAPFVATLVDVTGLVIYFSVASFLLKGVLLT